MRLIDWILRGAPYLNVGAMIAVVLWVLWVVSLTAEPTPADSPAVHSLHACPCTMTRPAART